MARGMVFSITMALYPQISSTSIYQELVRNAISPIPPQIYHMRPSGAWALQSVLKQASSLRILAEWEELG